MPLSTVSAVRRRDVLALLALAPLARATRADGTAPTTSPRVRFASVDEGRAVLGADDAWVVATGEFQRGATVDTRAPVSREALRSFLAGTVRPWPESQARRWQRAVDAVLPRATALRVPLPPEILLVNSDGRDAANMPYTRGHAIVLPTDALASKDPQRTDPFLVAHELFHIVTRHDPALADRLYALVGFEPVEPLQWPAAWLEARIANPDAPLDRHAMRLAIDGRETLVMPLLVASRTELRPGENFFSVMELRLLEVRAAPGTPTRPVLRDGEPVWHAPERLPAYAARLGGNTGYILHADEVLADNFAQLVTGRTVPNPALLKQLEAALDVRR
jgi:hypothetical protein